MADFWGSLNSQFLEFVIFGLSLFVTAWFIGPMLAVVIGPLGAYWVEWKLGRRGIWKEDINSWTHAQMEEAQDEARQWGADAVSFGRAIALGLIPNAYAMFAPDVLPAWAMNAPWAVMLFLRNDRLIFPLITVFVGAISLL